MAQRIIPAGSPISGRDDVAVDVPERLNDHAVRERQIGVAAKVGAEVDPKILLLERVRPNLLLGDGRTTSLLRNARLLAPRHLEPTQLVLHLRRRHEPKPPDSARGLNAELLAIARGEDGVLRIVDGRILRDAVDCADARRDVGEQTLPDSAGLQVVSPSVIIVIITKLGTNGPCFAEQLPPR